MVVRLLIADDHEVVRAGLRSLLTGEDDLQLVAEACDGDEALRLALEHRPDVALIDVRMPGCDGIAALGRLRAELPEVAVVMFTGHDNPTFAARSLALGAAGYLVKSAARHEILSAIRRAATGQSLWTRGELRKVAGAMATPRGPSDLEAPLTRREIEVLVQIAVGLSNKEIAQSLNISYETVKEHVQHVLKKLGMTDRTQAAVWAVRHGLA